LKRLTLWIFSLTALFLPILSQSANSLILPPIASPSSLQGHGWQYTLDFRPENPEKLVKLIQCESQGVNVSRPDSDGIFSDGILQFHRASKNSLIGSGTWAWMEKLSGLRGSPIIPADAIRMTDWAISHGLGPHWTCWHLQHLGG
jgi:hypothetical protein